MDDNIVQSLVETLPGLIRDRASSDTFRQAIDAYLESHGEIIKQVFLAGSFNPDLYLDEEAAQDDLERAVLEHLVRTAMLLQFIKVNAE